VREVVDLIAAAAGAGIEPEYLGEGTPDGEINRQYVDSTKLRELTGWRPRVELADGLRRTLEWYESHPQARPAKLTA
jgi:nucleoside-diphosphate-sugar epimerase